MKQSVTYLIKLKDRNLWITNKPTDNFPAIKYSTERRDAKEFDGLDNATIDMTNHIAIKKTVTETTEYEEVENDY
ncbi:DUF2483 family protein [Staphylococcus devriesei]|uniref:DUF2483 family protein n=1 Tax=Staphylococcus devriesei TaxID=586733 RepID=UPI000CD0643F|nr:DUF2483 family protein [Staphylococcus devriesei]PNZ85722.1 hypothetical protein CD147_11265 [Staphylococcus devriesei]PTF03951.1 DUF2483 domain-containing protein [Staphylococcus devriesei]SUM03880.1 phage protein [Staphylococcus devriesei]